MLVEMNLVLKIGAVYYRLTKLLYLHRVPVKYISMKLMECYVFK
jgi:hypothetical protein